MHSRRVLDLGSMNHVDIGRKCIDAPAGYAAGLFSSRIMFQGRAARS